MHGRIAFLGCLILAAGLIFATDAGADGVYGDYIIDYTYIAGHHLDGALAPDSSEMDIAGWNGFGIRRARIGFKRSLTPELSMDFRLEAGQPDWMSSLGYDGKSAGTATPFVKDAYLSYAVTPELTVRGGLQANPMNTNAEAVWGYRSIEKLVTDLHSFDSSRDLGISLIGRFDDFYFTGLVGNGQGDKSETYKGKEVFLIAGYMPITNMYVEGGVAYEAEAEGQTHTTIQGLVGYRGSAFHGGIQYASFSRSFDGDADDLDIGAISVFAGVPVSPKVEIVARYDRVDEDPTAHKISGIHMANYAPTNTIIGGVAFTPAPNFQIIPNVEYVSYGTPEDDGVETPDSDTFVRLTLWNKW